MVQHVRSLDGTSAESIYETSKLTLLYAALGCVWMLLVHAAFISVVMVSGCEGSCGGTTSLYS